MRRLWDYLRRRYGPRCGAAGPVTQAGTCVVYRGHERDPLRPSPEWHADGTGYIWDDREWRWMGEPR